MSGGGTAGAAAAAAAGARRRCLESCSQTYCDSLMTFHPKELIPSIICVAVVILIFIAVIVFLGRKHK